MARRRADIKNSATKGVLDPELSERTDLSHYWNSLRAARNSECKPQGGWRRRNGTTINADFDVASGGYEQRLRRRIVPLELTAAMITTHNGGSASNLIDQSLSTTFVTSAAGAGVFVLVEVDLGVEIEVTFVDVIGYSCAGIAYENVLELQYWDGAWQTFANSGDPNTLPRFSIRTSSRTRRFGNWPGGNSGAPVSARQWRLVLKSASAAGVITIKGLRMWEEQKKLSPVRGFSYARTSDLVHEMILMERNIDVFRNHRYIASIPVDVDIHQIDDVKFISSQDTIFLFHENIATTRILRQGGDDEWHSEPFAATNVPTLSSGTALAGDQDEVQEIDIFGLAEGDRVIFWFGDAVTSPVTYNGLDTWASSVESAIEALPGNLAGLNVSLTGSTTPSLRLTFRGASGSRRWPDVAPVVLGESNATVRPRVLQRGLDANGPFFGPTTGYPRCGQIVDSRIMLAGFRGSPQSYGFSRFGSFSFLDEADPFTADLGFFNTLDTKELETIHEISEGQHLQLFTDSSVWYLETRTISAEQPPNARRVPSVGYKSTTPVQFADGGTIFVQHGGKVVQDMVFSDLQQTYEITPLTLLGPHLLKNVTRVGYRIARRTSEGNQLYLVNDNGTLVQIVLVRGQEVVAMAPWDTDGKFRDVFGDIQERVWIIVERENATGEKNLYLEELDDRHPLDAATVYWRDAVTTQTVPGLGMHEGKQVWAFADGELLGPLKVQGGEVTLPTRVSSAVVGLAPEWYSATQIVRGKLPDGAQFRGPGRIYEIELGLVETSQLEIAVNGGDFEEVCIPDNIEAAELDLGELPERDTAGISSGLPSTDLVNSEMEQLIRAVTMIPASGEFVYSTELVRRNDGFQFDIVLNGGSPTGEADFLVSLGQVNQGLTNLKNMSLFAGWYGSDLRASHCTIKPKVDNKNVNLVNRTWSVGGVDRASADLISSHNGEVAFGSSPDDASIVEAIDAIKSHGWAATLTPFLMMDIPSGNGLSDPYGGAEQPAYPWRGRITCDPAPGQPGTVDLTPTAAGQNNTFVGTCSVSDFSIVGTDVIYTGPAEWSYRRFILHYAHLAKAAGGIDTFVIGSEMRGLTWVRDALGSYPFVDALKTLAADVKTVLPDANVTYAADWSEFTPHQTGVPGEVFFHLDPLWTDPNIDAIGMDNYWPLSDWRDGTDHADYGEWFSVKNINYLRSNIFGGEGYDWYYASAADRDNQVRTPITDGLGKPWVWRYKDIRNWWANHHHNRPGGIEDATATAWVPQSKPIWMMEAGCPAVDRGSNQPNVFYDPKSSESFFPYHSEGIRDDEMQRAHINAFISFFDPEEKFFANENNPISTVYGGRMVDHERIYIYTFDARYYPAFPLLDHVWGDAELWQYGHWLNGRIYLNGSGTPGVIDDALPVGQIPEFTFRDAQVTGRIRMTNLQGWSRHPTIELRQSNPSPIEIRSIQYQVVHNG